MTEREKLFALQAVPKLRRDETRVVLILSPTTKLKDVDVNETYSADISMVG